jgi:hypothetical protein
LEFFVADDIVTRLRDRLDSVVFVPDREDLRQAADEIERLRKALALAAYEVATYGPYRYTSPDQLAESFLRDARRG